MNQDATVSDLVVLTADKNMRFMLEGLLSRPKALSIRPVIAVFYIHPERDPGCLLRADAFLRPFVNQFHHAIVMFDREGCGKQKKSRQELEEEVLSNLSLSGWGDRATAIVIDPELENWVFSDSPEVDAVIGWAANTPPLRSWLEEKNFLTPGQIKPLHPKEAMESALRHVRMARSSSIYKQLAEQVGLGRCTDQAFLKLKDVLQSWFPVLEDKK
jgi:hypothetical protein